MNVGQKVSWSSSGGTARGIIRSIHRDGEVPNTPVKIAGTEDEPAARIELLDGEGEPRGEFVGHKLSTLNVSKAYGAEPLYGFRPVMNAERIREWMADSGFEFALLPDDMHVTVVFSRDAFDPDLTREANHAETDPYPFWGSQQVVVRGGKRQIAPLGDKGAVVLKIESLELQREHLMFREMGASWDFESYLPHVTLTYQGGPDGLETLPPFPGDIVLGPLAFRPLNPEAGQNPEESRLDKDSTTPLRDSQKSAIMDGDMKSADFNKTFEVIKAEDEQRIVYGWASVSTVKGELFVDSQGDIIEPDEMVKMANDFMLDVRTAKAMHNGARIGEFIHSLPLTKELATALGIETDREGWIVAAKIHDDAIWQKVRSGEMTGFSIGGKSQRREAVE